MRTFPLYLALFFTVTLAQAEAPVTISQALARGDWDTSLTLAKQADGQTLEQQSLPYAQADIVPAMWIMGQARFLQHDLNGAAIWFYRGWLGLQMDLALCRYTDSRRVTNVLMESFTEGLSSARNDMNARTVGVNDAADHYSEKPEREPQPGWSCRWADPNGRQRSLTVLKEKYPKLHSLALSNFISRTGITPATIAPNKPFSLMNQP